MQTLDISYPMLIMIYGLLVLPLVLCRVLKINVVASTLSAVSRMTVQLVLVAFYLDFIFRLNSIWLNAGWVLLMMVIANISSIRSAGLKLKTFFLTLLGGLAFGTLLVVTFFVFIAIRPEPLYDARYLIPITGMVIGNCLRANVISLERFYTSIRRNENEFLTYLLMGATLWEAVLPYLREALKSALAPTIATMATLGLVALPGMMTGQLLGGSPPGVAIKYQIAIMIVIYVATMLTATMNIVLSLKVSFTPYQQLDVRIFADHAST